MIASLIASTSGQTGRVLLDILIIVVAAKLAAEVADRIGIPTVVGEITAGIAIGPSVLGIVTSGEVLGTLAELGVILLLLEVGMHMDLRELKSVGRAAMMVAVVGVALPFAGGMVVGPLFDLTTNQSLFIAAALTATSVGITARVFGDLKALATTEARTVLGAAVADDVLGLIILTVVVRVVTGNGSVTVSSIAYIIALALVFLAVTTIIGTLAAPFVFRFIERHARSSATMFALALAFALGVAQLATLAKLAPIIGAFVAGLSLGRTNSAAKIQRELTPVGHLFIPIFFLQIGINVQASSFANASVLGLGAALTVVAVIGKVAAGWSIGSAKADRLTIGLGMIPRGEVGLIFASIGLAAGVFTQNLYASILLMVLVTTLITPPLLSWRFNTLRTQTAQIATSSAGSIAGTIAPSATTVTPEPSGGWLLAANDQLTLAGTPHPDHLLHVALPAARSLAEGRIPSEQLATWIRTNAPLADISWTAKNTESLLQVLQFGTQRSWRFLEVTGVLDRALPELARSIARRRSDALLLDPTGVHRWPTVERVKELFNGRIDTRAEAAVLPVAARIDEPRHVLLAALLIDASNGELAIAQAILDRLCLDQTSADEVGNLVADSGMLLSSALSPDGFTSESVLRIAVHMGSQSRADGHLVLAVAANGLESWERAALFEMHALLSASLTSPDGEPRFATTAHLLEQRRADVRTHIHELATPSQLVDALTRAENAPINYVITTDPLVVARHALLLTPPPRRGEVTVSIADVSPNGTATIELAATDVIGLLARSSGVLEAVGLSIEHAEVTTWSDGTALQSFNIKSVAGHLPGADEIQSELIETMHQPLRSAPVTDAAVQFDNAVSPWHTVCEFRATDRPGLLHAVTAAFAVSGVDIHAARISTADELVFDTFNLTTRTGSKLDAELQDRLRQVLHTGVIPMSRNWFTRRLANTLGT
jgi:Kef-type K+ transport system membrane component KefB